MKKKYLENDGFALASVLIIMFVLMILGTALLTVVFSDTKHAIYSENNLEAHFLARSGADIVFNEIKFTKVVPYGIIGVKQDLSDAFGSKSYTVKSLTTVGSNLNVVVTGEANGVTEDITVVLDVVASAETAFQRPFHVNNPVDIGNKNNEKDKAENKDKLLITYPEGFSKEDIEAHKPISDSDEIPFAYPVPIIDVPKLKNPLSDLFINKLNTELINTSMRYDLVNIKGGKFVLETNPASTLQIVMDSLIVDKDGEILINGDGELEVYVNTMAFNQNAKMTIQGDARIKIFVKNSADINNPWTNLLVSEEEEPVKLLIVLGKDASLTMGSNADMKAYIYGPEAIVYMNSAHTTLHGAIISNIFNKQHSINAPNGAINFIPSNDGSYSEYNGVNGYSKSQYKRGN